MKKQKTRSNEKKAKERTGKKSRIDFMKIYCWFIVPAIITLLLLLDALNIYTFNKERLIVLGIALLTVMLPFFSEIGIKDLSLKRNSTKNKNDRT